MLAESVVPKLRVKGYPAGGGLLPGVSAHVRDVMFPATLRFCAKGPARDPVLVQVDWSKILAPTP